MHSTTCTPLAAFPKSGIQRRRGIQSPLFLLRGLVAGNTTGRESIHAHIPRGLPAVKYLCSLPLPPALSAAVHGPVCFIHRACRPRGNGTVLNAAAAAIVLTREAPIPCIRRTSPSAFLDFKQLAASDSATSGGSGHTNSTVYVASRGCAMWVCVRWGLDKRLDGYVEVQK